MNLNYFRSSKVIVPLSLLLVHSFCSAQINGSIVPARENPKEAVSNIYIYHPPQKILLPDNIAVLILYINNDRLTTKTIVTKKSANAYTFQFTFPDSVSVAVMGIVSAEQNLSKSSSLSQPKDRC